MVDLVLIGEREGGQLDLSELEQQLKKYSNRKLLIGSFSGKR
jgi:hypothetical protein